MKFHRLENEKPEVGYGREILIKYDDVWNKNKEDEYHYVKYYVCHYIEDKVYGHVFEEAGGEQYGWWTENQVIGWMYTDELNEIEVE